MKNKHQIVYIWSFIILACFILLLLYTPIGGGLNLRPTSVYTINNKSVQFSGAIINSPKTKSSQLNKSTENEIPSVSVLPNFTRKTYIKNNTRRNQSSSYAPSSQAAQSSNSTSAMGGSPYTIGGKGNKNSNTNNNSYATISQPFSDESINNNLMQKAPMDDDPISDPGGEPEGAPLPVGSGILVLITLSILYTFFLYKKKLRVS